MNDLILKLIAGLAKLTVFSLVLNLGLGWRFSDITWLWQRPRLLLRSLISVIVLMPTIAVLVTRGFIPPGPTAIAIGAMAASPGAPLLPRQTVKVWGNLPFVVSLQITLSVVAVVTLPLTVTIFSLLFPNQAVVYPLTVAKQVALVQLLPLSIGMLIRKVWPDFASDMEKSLSKIANNLFLVLAIAILVTQLDHLLQPIIIPKIIVISIITILSLAVGHFLGGSDLPTRTHLALATSTRNAGLAIFLVTLNFSEPKLRPGILDTIILYVLVNAIAAFGYISWQKKRINRQKETFV